MTGLRCRAPLAPVPTAHHTKLATVSGPAELFCTAGLVRRTPWGGGVAWARLPLRAVLAWAPRRARPHPR